MNIDGESWYQRYYPLRLHNDVFGYVFRFIPRGSYVPGSTTHRNAAPEETQFIIKSAQMMGIKKLVATYAANAGAIVVQGESGTGKELIAREIHRLSPFSNGPLVAVNAGSIPHELFESEMFGYREGAFTSSRRGGHVGLLEQANTESFFLMRWQRCP